MHTLQLLMQLFLHLILLIQHVIHINLEQIVQKTAINSVADQTITATTLMDHAPLDVLMDMKEKNVKLVSKVFIIVVTDGLKYILI